MHRCFWMELLPWSDISGSNSESCKTCAEVVNMFKGITTFMECVWMISFMTMKSELVRPKRGLRKNPNRGTMCVGYWLIFSRETQQIFMGTKTTNSQIWKFREFSCREVVGTCTRFRGWSFIYPGSRRSCWENLKRLRPDRSKKLLESSVTFVADTNAWLRFSLFFPARDVLASQSRRRQASEWKRKFADLSCEIPAKAAYLKGLDGHGLGADGQI